MLFIFIITERAAGYKTRPARKFQLHCSMPTSDQQNEPSRARSGVLTRSSRSSNRTAARMPNAATIPPIPVTAPPAAGTVDVDDICGICFESFTTLCHLHPCKHRFDYDCIDPWLQSLFRENSHPDTMTCPLCRGIIKNIQRTNPDVLTDTAVLFPQDARGASSTSVSFRGVAADNSSTLLQNPRYRSTYSESWQLGSTTPGRPTYTPEVIRSWPAPDIQPTAPNAGSSNQTIPGARIQSAWNDARMGGYNYALNNPYRRDYPIAWNLSQQGQQGGEMAFLRDKTRRRGRSSLVGTNTTARPQRTDLTGNPARYARHGRR